MECDARPGRGGEDADLTRFSLVIPAYNEEAYLPRLLDSVDAARQAYSGGTDGIEVIVSDNASTDHTEEVARARGCTVVRVEKRVIAAVRNGGARVARGEVLTFVDADSQIHPQTFNEIDRVLAAGRVVGGATGIRFERSSPGILCTQAMLMMVGIVMRAAMGEPPRLTIDSGVVFCLRRDFEQIGGYSEERNFGEDVQLLLDLRRLGRPRRQHLARGMRAPALFSTRKFDRFGDWHFFVLPWHIVPSFFWRRSGHTDFTRRYWYER